MVMFLGCIVGVFTFFPLLVVIFYIVMRKTDLTTIVIRTRGIGNFEITFQDK